ncbi:MAG: alkaline phosphatase [Methanospirillum sp.]
MNRRYMFHLIPVAALLLLVCVVSAFSIPQAGTDTQGFANGPDLQDSKAKDLGNKMAKAKNVILLIGDGMGYSELTAARWEKANESLATYATTSLALDHLEYSGYVTTYCADSFITDSAPAATAIMAGVKTNLGVIGEDATAVNKKSDGARVASIAELAKRAGKATGAVTTTRITHATPAGLYAHVNDRDNETLISSQLLASGMDLAFGGGYPYFINATVKDPWGAKGKRTDGRDLIAEFRSAGYTVVNNSTGLAGVKAREGTKVLGLFSSSHMEYDRARNTTNEPSLAAMTGKALEILGKDKDGLFLMVEGGRIDHAGHARDYANNTGDTLAFDAAVQTALDFTKKNPDTLVIVTADHETGGLTLGATTNANYAAGMSPYFPSGGNLTKDANGTAIIALDPAEASHTAVDVPILASGPGAIEFGRGMIDNTEIFTRMKAALRV